MNGENQSREKTRPQGDSKSKKKLVILVVVVIAMIALATGMIGYLQSDAYHVAKQMDMGQKYLDELKYEQALAEFQGVIEIDPKNVDAYLGMADAYVGMDDPIQAVNILNQGYAETADQQLLEKVDTIVAGQLELAQNYVAEADYAHAIIKFRQIIEIDSENVEAYLYLAETYLSMGDVDQAVETLRKGYAKTNDQRLADAIDSIVAERLVEAQKYLSDRNYAQALEEFQSVRDIDEECADAYLGMADSYVGNEDVPQAIQILETGYEKTSDERILEALNRYKVQCKDQEFEAMIKQQLGKSTEDLYLSDTMGIQELEINGDGKAEVITEWVYVWKVYPDLPIEDQIAPFGVAAYPCDGELAEEYNRAGYEAVEIEKRFYGDGTIRTLSGIESFTELTSLKITQNNINDISALSNLTKLTYVNLDQNDISDISALGNLVELDILILSNNRINDISALRNLIKLTVLNLSGNGLGDISSLDDLDKLENMCTILSQLPNLQALYISDVVVNDIGLLRLPELRQSDIEMLQNELAVDPSNVWVYFALAEKYVQEGNSSMATTILQEGFEATSDKRLEKVAEAIS